MKLIPYALLSLVFVLVSVAGANAQSASARYQVTTFAGISLGEVDAVVTLSKDGYLVSTRSKPHRMARLFGAGEQSSMVEGHWGHRAPLPLRYTMNGEWREEQYFADLRYIHGSPTIHQLGPPDPEREPVPIKLTASTIDPLSMMAHIARQIGSSGTCDARAAIYDGWRRTQVVASTDGARVPEGNLEWPCAALLLRKSPDWWFLTRLQPGCSQPPIEGKGMDRQRNA